MATIKSFEELKVWKDSRKIVTDIYHAVDYFPKTESYGLTSQITASVSNVNIAEGFARDSIKNLYVLNNIQRLNC